MSLGLTQFNEINIKLFFRRTTIMTRALRRLDHLVVKSEVNGFDYAPSLLWSLKGRETIDFLRDFRDDQRLKFT